MGSINVAEESEQRKLLFDCLERGGATDVEAIGEYEICMKIDGKEVSINACWCNTGTAELDIFICEDT